MTFRSLGDFPVFGLDIETDHAGKEFNPKNLSEYLFGCSLRIVILGDGVNVEVVDLYHEPPEEVEKLREFLTTSPALFVGVNMRNFDIPVLMRTGFCPQNFMDLDEMSRLVHSGDQQRVFKHGLDEMLKRECDIEKLEMEDYSIFADPDPLPDYAYDYCVRDVEHLVQLFDTFYEKLEEMNALPALKLEMAVCPILARMCFNGFRINKTKLLRHIADATERAEEYEAFVAETLEIPDFNIRRQDDQRLFFRRQGISPPVAWSKAKARKVLSTDKRDLASLLAKTRKESDRDAIRSFAHISELKKTQDFSSLLVTDEDSRIHPRFTSLGAATTRMSSRSPNAQNIPRKIRSFVEAKKGNKIVTADLGQIEPRTLALDLRDKELVRACESDDFYISVAASSLSGVEELGKKDFNERYPELRDQIKVYFLATSYGGGADNMVTQTALESLLHFGGTNSRGEEVSGDPPPIMTKETAVSLMRSVDGAFRKRWAAIQHCRAIAKNSKGSVVLPIAMGYRRRLFPKFGRGLNPNEILNTPNQGIAAIMLKLALKQMQDAGIAQYLINVVHDEVVLEVPEALADSVAEKVVQSFKRSLGDLSEHFDLSILSGNPEDFIRVDVVVADSWEKP